MVIQMIDGGDRLDINKIKKLTFGINTFILFLVFGLAGYFYLCDATFLIWFSIPTAMVYLFGYFFIAKDRLDIYVRFVYFWLTLYMCVTTICLGYKFGFHLYCLSMIPIIFYTEYMAEKLGKKKINAIAASGIIALCYLLSTGYTAFKGAIYEADNILTGMFWIINSVIVLAFLVFYSRLMLNMVGDYEQQLKKAALVDRLTGLYNRHYMVNELETAVLEESPKFLAMVDIDDFKKINDRYGHNAGDFVLVNVSRIMKEMCSDSRLSRWGGEEFLILSQGGLDERTIAFIENLRRKIESEDFFFENEHIKVTITAGMAEYDKKYSIDEWVSTADDRLYYGKRNGKNKVISS